MHVLHYKVFIRWFSQSPDLQEIIFPDSKSKNGLSDSLILKTETKPIKTMVVIIVPDWIQSIKTLFQPFKSFQAKFQTSNLKPRSEKANCLEQKSTISWFQRPQMGGVFLSVVVVVGDKISMHIRPDCSRLRRNNFWNSKNWKSASTTFRPKG